MTRSLRVGAVIAGGAVMLAVAGLATGCASQAGFTNGAIAATSGDGAPAAATSGGPTRVTSWRLLSSDPQGTTLVIGVALGGSCERFDRVDVLETDSAVTITPIVLTDLAEACTDSLEMVERTVSLHDPLGERALVHGELAE